MAEKLYGSAKRVDSATDLHDNTILYTRAHVLPAMKQANARGPLSQNGVGTASQSWMEFASNGQEKLLENTVPSGTLLMALKKNPPSIQR